MDQTDGAAGGVNRFGARIFFPFPGTLGSYSLLLRARTVGRHLTIFGAPHNTFCHLSGRDTSPEVRSAPPPAPLSPSIDGVSSTCVGDITRRGCMARALRSIEWGLTYADAAKRFYGS